ncbi:MAG: hypothetical protein ACRDLY_17650 [Thermoleophilaceae bacterium]
MAKTEINRARRMTGRLRIPLFAVALALAFGAAAAAGSALDPDPPGDDSEAGHPDMRAHDDTRSHGDTHRNTRAQDDLRLVNHAATFPRATRETLRFRIVNREGDVVRDFDVEHDRRMHAILVRRDLTGFRHVHPEQQPDGSWTVPLSLPDAGSYRLFADFAHAGRSYTLGSDIRVAGEFKPRELPHPAETAAAGDGYEVRLAENGANVRFSVFKDGERLRDVEPYLGARGHLVALREGDLAFLHVHPESAATEGAEIRFGVEYPSNGRYRLFLQFKHDGRVRTAAFTQEVGVEPGH